MLVEGEAIADPRAAVVARQGEANMAERLHDGDHVAAHGALGIGLVILVAARRGGPAIAAQVHADHPVGLGQGRRHAVPHGVGLGKAVQQHQGRAVAFRAGEDPTGLRVDPVRLESGKEVVAHGFCCSRADRSWALPSHASGPGI